MKRSLITALVSVSTLCGLSGCDNTPRFPDGGINYCAKGFYQSTPYLCPSVDSLGFGQEFNTGTPIGTKPPQTINVRNNGTVPMEVTAATLAGDKEFSLNVSWEAPDGGFGTGVPATINGGKNLFLQVIFAPTQAKLYTGSLTVTNNSSNAPMKVFGLSGCGIPTDGGTSPCYADGGRP
jgi:hypothetical protein